MSNRVKKYPLALLTAVDKNKYTYAQLITKANQSRTFCAHEVTFLRVPTSEEFHIVIETLSYIPLVKRRITFKLPDLDMTFIGAETLNVNRILSSVT